MCHFYVKARYDIHKQNITRNQGEMWAIFRYVLMKIPRTLWRCWVRIYFWWKCERHGRQMCIKIVDYYYLWLLLSMMMWYTVKLAKKSIFCDRNRSIHSMSVHVRLTRKKVKVMNFNYSIIIPLSTFWVVQKWTENYKSCVVSGSVNKVWLNFFLHFCFSSSHASK